MRCPKCKEEEKTKMDLKMGHKDTNVKIADVITQRARRKGLL